MDEFEVTQQPDSPPLRVHVVNLSDFHEDLTHKIVAAVAVATCVGLVKMGFDYMTPDRREKRKAAKAEKKTLKIK